MVHGTVPFNVLRLLLFHVRFDDQSPDDDHAHQRRHSAVENRTRQHLVAQVNRETISLVTPQQPITIRKKDKSHHTALTKQ